MLTKTYFRRKLAQACGLGLVLCAAAACAPQQNVLTKEEIADGWQLLFDGKTLDQWKDYNGEELTMPWHVVDGCIQAKGDGSDLAGYIVTKKQYENFILDWDWKLSHGGNSGMIYHVVEDPYFKVPYVTGPEYQLIDNEGWEEVNAPNKLEEWQKLGVDYAIMLQNIERAPTAANSVFLAAASTLLAFGLLAFSATPALHLFGMTLAVALALVLVLTVLLRPGKEA